MFKYTKLILLSMTLIFSACGGGGGDSTTTKSPSKETLSKAYSIDTTEENNITVDGKNGDKLLISIPKNPFLGFDDNVTFSLEYTDGNPLPRIIISEDINFTYQATLEFTSDYLSEHNLSFVYEGSNRDYRVPFTQVGNKMIAKLSHFSTYTWETTPSNDVLKKRVEDGLKEIKSQLDANGPEGVNKDLLNDVFDAINTLRYLFKEVDVADGYTDELSKLFGDAIVDYLESIENDTLTYIEGYCPSKEVIAYISKVVKYMTEAELIGYDEAGLDALAKKIIDERMTELYNQFSALTPPPACEVENMKKYQNCGVKIATEMELAGVDVSLRSDGSDPLYYKLQEDFLGVANSLASKLSLDACACTKTEIQFYKDGADEFYNIGYSELSSQADAVSKLLQQELNKTPNCKTCPYVWDITYSETNVAHGEAGLEDDIIANGTTIFKNIFIYPRCEFTLSSDEYEACSPYMNRYPTSFSTYEYNDGELINNNVDQASITYAGFSSSGLCFRDPEGENDTPLTELPASYLEKGPNEETVYARVIGEGSATYGNTIEIDIFEEIHSQKSFSVSTSRGKLDFTHK